MASNIVEILIGAKDDAKLDLDSLKARLDELAHKVAEAKVKVAGDKEAEALLDKLGVKLLSLDRRTSNPKIKLEGAFKASTEIAALNVELDRFGRKVEEAKVKVDKAGGASGLLGKLMGGAGGAGGLSGMAAGGGGIAAAIGALLVEVDGLASGFAAAGAGAGAFGLLAMPALKKVMQGYQGIQTAHQAYIKALAMENVAPTKANAAAVVRALDAQKIALAGLSPAERGAVQSLQSFMDTFNKMSKAFQPTAFKVFNDALKVLSNLLPAVTPFAKTFGNALDGLLKGMAGFTKITEPLTGMAHGMGMVRDAAKTTLTPFGQWLQQFHRLEGPSVTAIGHGVGQVAIAIGKLLTIMSKKDVVNAINIAFTVLADTINALGFVIRRIMLRWDQWQQLFRQVGHATSQVTHAIASDFDSMRHGVSNAIDAVRQAFLRMGHDIESVFNSIKGAVGGAVDWIVGKIHTLTGALSSINGALGGIPGKILSGLGFAAGGIAGAAAGGIRSNMTLVGEHGPELVQLSAGSRVYNNPQTMGMLGGSGGGVSTLVINVSLGGVHAGRAIVDVVQGHVRTAGGGDVQVALGTS